jgi:hypothetical protein
VDVGGHDGMVPGPPIDQRLPVGVERGAVKEKARTRSGGDDVPSLVLDMSDPVSRDSVGTDVGLRERFTSQRLDGVLPDLGEPHARALMPERPARFSEKDVVSRSDRLVRSPAR